MDIGYIRKQIQWLIEQVKCIKSGECACAIEETNLVFNPLTGELTSTHTDGSQRSVIINITDTASQGVILEENEFKLGGSISEPRQILMTDSTSALVFATPDNLNYFNIGEDAILSQTSEGDFRSQLFHTPSQITFNASNLNTGQTTQVAINTSGITLDKTVAEIDAAPNSILVTKEWVQAQTFGGGNATGLEALTEGPGIGWRLIGKDSNNYGNVGIGAVDISNSTSASTINGATGLSSFAANFNTRAFGIGSASFGSNTEAGEYALSMGGNTDALGRYSLSQGVNTIAGSLAEVSLGLNPTLYTTSNLITWEATDRLFNIGNGQQPTLRSDAFTILKSGEVTAPSLTTTIIDSETTGKVLITKEWFNANNSGGSSSTWGLESLSALTGSPVGLTTGFYSLRKGNSVNFRLILDGSITIDSDNTTIIGFLPAALHPAIPNFTQLHFLIVSQGGTRNFLVGIKNTGEVFLQTTGLENQVIDLSTDVYLGVADYEL